MPKIEQVDASEANLKIRTLIRAAEVVCNGDHAQMVDYLVSAISVVSAASKCPPGPCSGDGLLNCAIDTLRDNLTRLPEVQAAMAAARGRSAMGPG